MIASYTDLLHDVRAISFRGTNNINLFNDFMECLEERGQSIAIRYGWFWYKFSPFYIATSDYNLCVSRRYDVEPKPLPIHRKFEWTGQGGKEVSYDFYNCTHVFTLGENDIMFDLSRLGTSDIAIHNPRAEYAKSIDRLRFENRGIRMSTRNSVRFGFNEDKICPIVLLLLYMGISAKDINIYDETNYWARRNGEPNVSITVDDILNPKTIILRDNQQFNLTQAFEELYMTALSYKNDKRSGEEKSGMWVQFANGETLDVPLFTLHFDANERGWFSNSYKLTQRVEIDGLAKFIFDANSKDLVLYDTSNRELTSFKYQYRGVQYTAQTIVGTEYNEDEISYVDRSPWLDWLMMNNIPKECVQLVY